MEQKKGIGSLSSAKSRRRHGDTNIFRTLSKLLIASGVLAILYIGYACFTFEWPAGFILGHHIIGALWMLATLVTTVTGYVLAELLKLPQPRSWAGIRVWKNPKTRIGKKLDQKKMWIFLLSALSVPGLACAKNLGGPSIPPAAGTPLPMTIDPNDADVQLSQAYDPVVQVFYGTDREKKGRGYGSARDPLGLHYGTASVTLCVNYRRSKNPSAAWLGYAPTRHLHASAVDIREMPKEDYDRLVGKDLAGPGIKFNPRNESSGTIVFIHGYGNSLPVAVKLTAQMAYDLQLPGQPFCYSWPSQGDFWIHDYDRDKQRVEAKQTIDDLVDFIQDLASRPQTRDGQLTLVGDSMGTYLLSEALTRIASNPRLSGLLGRKVKHVIFIAADICVDKFTGPDGFFSRFGPFQRKLVLYVSSADSVLKVSDVLNRGDCKGGRVGYGGPGLQSLKGATTLDATHIDVGWGLGHGIQEHDGVIDDMYLFLNQGLRPSQRLLADRGAPDGENHYYDIFDGVHQIQKISDFSGVLAVGFNSQFGFTSDSLSNGFRLTAMLSTPYYQAFQLSLGFYNTIIPNQAFFNNIVPTQIDLRWNPWNDNFRPFLDAGLDDYDERTGGGQLNAFGGHLGAGVEYVFDSGLGLALGLNILRPIDVSGPIGSQPALNDLFNGPVLNPDQISFQINQYFDLNI